MSFLTELFTASTTWIIFALYAALLLWETLAPRRQLPRSWVWQFKGVAFFVVYVVWSSLLPRWWDPLLAPYQLFDLAELGTVGGTLVGLLVYEVVAWVYHRSLHAFAPLWRVHQTHHSAERLDVSSAFMFHPLDMLGWTAVGSVALVVLAGLTPQATTNILVILYLLAVFQHANVRTPHWLGFIVQRPESHTVHHGREVHQRNYADLPCIDMVFGTFENPVGDGPETGIYPGASSKYWALFTLRDLTSDRAQTDASSPRLPETNPPQLLKS